MITDKHSRAARAVLGWTKQDLANKSGLGTTTISEFESGKRKDMRLSTARMIREAFEKAGIEIIEGDRPGITWRKP